MIGMTYSEALFGVLVLWLVFILVLWLRELQRIKRHEWHLSNGRLFHCDICHHSFISKEQVSLTRCPRCNSICIRRKRRSTFPSN